MEGSEEARHDRVEANLEAAGTATAAVTAFITPYTPQQNGLIERFFRTLKEECVWQHQFESFEHAKRVITQWIRWYNEGRPHQSLGYLSPVRYRAQQGLLVA